MNSMHFFTQENCARTRGHSEVLSFYTFCKDIIWSVWARERVPWDFVSWGTKVNVFSLRLERIFHYALLLQMLRHPHAYKFFQAFPSMSQNLTMTKIRTSLQGKKKVEAASKIYALISISFICCDSHISFLQSAEQFH